MLSTISYALLISAKNKTHALKRSAWGVCGITSEIGERGGEEAQADCSCSNFVAFHCEGETFV